MVVVDSPRTSHFGGVVAAPAFEQIGTWLTNYLGIRPDKPCDRSVQLGFPPRMQLAALIEAVRPRAVRGRADAEITAVTYRADAVVPGALHVCVPGHTADGHDFAGEAVRRGAAALVVERDLPLDVHAARRRVVAAAMAAAADAFYGRPSAALDVVGITGTNGKTTTAFLLHAVLEAAGRQSGLLGTVEQRVGGRVEPVVRTTPESVDLQACCGAWSTPATRPA